ncbi:MAG TPA: hypothetical protein VI197_10740 [Polyangiaceae bacterium]
MRPVSSSCIAVVLVAQTACQVTPEPRDAPSSSAPAPAAQARGVVSQPVHIEALDPSAVPATYVLRGGSPGKQRMVFLHGMCGHAMGYAQSFQFSAARHGRIVAPQADIVCGKGPWAKWSNDLAALDERIQSAFIALGDQPPIDDILVMGYSQGATRAVDLARKYPDRYSRLISIGAPGVTKPQGLSHLKAALMMAGERDRQDQMKTSARLLSAKGIRSEFREIPKATHGSMGPHPELTMSAALDWVYTSATPAR